MRRDANLFTLLACLLLLSDKSTIAFVLPSIRTPSVHTNKLPSTTTTSLNLESLEQKTPDEKQVERLLDTYSEKSRLYRRNVFGAADWVRSRRPNRYAKYLRSTFDSGLLRQIQLQLVATIVVSCLVVLYNDLLAQGYTDLTGTIHDGLLPWLPPAELPIVSWSLSSGSLGLLLTFRTSVSYSRWNEARTAWGKVINDSRSIARMACIWSKSYKSIDNDSLQRLGDAICSFSRSLMNRTLPKQEDEANFVMYTYKKIRDQSYGRVLRQAQHRPTAALAEITSILVDFQLNPLHQVEVEKVTTGLCDALGASERIFTSPVPTFYTRHTARFLALWMFTLPMGLYEPLGDSWNHWAVIPMTIIIATLFLGIEELATQMEEPFSILPMEKMCEGSIRTAVMEQVERSQQGKQAAYCGEDGYLVDASPDNVRALPHFLGDQVNGGIAPEHFVQEVEPTNGESSFQANGDVIGLSHQSIQEEDKPDPKMEATPTFEEYMKARNQDSLR